MKNCVIMVGPPGSGKSTLAKSRFADHYYINQDSQGKACKADFANRVKDGRDIVVDRMNFSRKQREEFVNGARQNGYNIHIVLFHIPKSFCLSRVSKRNNHETISNLDQFYSAFNTFISQYERPEQDEYDTIETIGLMDAKDCWVGNRCKCVVFDLDGTMCNIDHRLHYVRNEDKKKNDWGKFFDLIPGDELNDWCKRLHESLKLKYSIVFCSGRSERYRMQTIQWLQKNGLSYSDLFMRPESDSRKDWIVKENILDFEILPRYNPIMFIDDRTQVVQMWRRRGFVCLQCADGNF